jgi:hypothetical protein
MSFKRLIVIDNYNLLQLHKRTCETCATAARNGERSDCREGNDIWNAAFNDEWHKLNIKVVVEHQA